eukprot:1082276-Pyramimonas_sp.AAC.1
MWWGSAAGAGGAVAVLHHVVGFPGVSHARWVRQVRVELVSFFTMDAVRRFLTETVIPVLVIKVKLKLAKRSLQSAKRKKGDWEKVRVPDWSVVRIYLRFLR